MRDGKFKLKQTLEFSTYIKSEGKLIRGQSVLYKEALIFVDSINQNAQLKSCSLYIKQRGDNFKDLPTDSNIINNRYFYFFNTVLFQKNGKLKINACDHHISSICISFKI